MLVNDVISLCTSVRDTVVFIRRSNKKIRNAVKSLEFELSVLESLVSNIVEDMPISRTSENMLSAVMEASNDLKKSPMYSTPTGKCIGILGAVFGRGVSDTLAKLENIEGDLKKVVSLLSLEMLKITAATLSGPEMKLAQTIINKQAREFWYKSFGYDMYVDRRLFSDAMEREKLYPSGKVSRALKDYVISKIQNDNGDKVYAQSFSEFFGGVDIVIRDVVSAAIKDIVKQHTICGLDTRIACLAKINESRVCCFSSYHGKVTKINFEDYSSKVLLIPNGFYYLMAIDDDSDILIGVSSKHDIDVVNLSEMNLLGTTHAIDEIVHLCASNGRLCYVCRNGAVCKCVFSELDTLSKTYVYQWETLCPYSSWQCRFVKDTIVINNAISVVGIPIKDPDERINEETLTRDSYEVGDGKHVLCEGGYEYVCYGSNIQMVTSDGSRPIFDSNGLVIDFDVFDNTHAIVLLDTNIHYVVKYKNIKDSKEDELLHFGRGERRAPERVELMMQHGENQFDVVIAWNMGDITIQKVSVDVEGNTKTLIYTRIPSLSLVVSTTINEYIPEIVMKRFSTSVIEGNDLLLSCYSRRDRNYWATIVKSAYDQCEVKMLDLAISCHVVRNDLSHWYVGVMNDSMNGFTINTMDEEGNIILRSNKHQGVATRIFVTANNHVALLVCEKLEKKTFIFTAHSNHISCDKTFRETMIVCSSQFSTKVVCRDTVKASLRTFDADTHESIIHEKLCFSSKVLGTFVGVSLLALLDIDVLSVVSSSSMALIARYTLNVIPCSVTQSPQFDDKRFVVSSRCGKTLLFILDDSGHKLRDVVHFKTHTEGKTHACLYGDTIVVAGDRGGIIWINANECLPSNFKCINSTINSVDYSDFFATAF